MHTALASIEKLMKEPPGQMAVGASLLFIAERVVVGFLVGGSGLIGVFEQGFRRGLWNIDRVSWLAILLVVVAWIVVASSVDLDQAVIGGAVAIFLAVSVLIENVLFDLPNVLIDLYFTLSSALLVPALAVGLLGLIRVAGREPGATPLITDAPAPAPIVVPPQSAAPAPAPTEVAPAQEPGWLPDPRREAELRWWDGAVWTDHTHNS